MNTHQETQIFDNPQFIGQLNQAKKVIAEYLDPTSKRIPLENTWCMEAIEIFIYDCKKIELLCDHSKNRFEKPLKDNLRKFVVIGEIDVNKNSIVSLLYYLYVVLSELDFQRDSTYPELDSLLSNIRSEINSFDVSIRPRFTWATYMLPSVIVKAQMQKNEFKQMLALPGEVGKAKNLENSLIQKIAEIDKKMEEMRLFLKKLKANYNFAGLTEGFRDLRGIKRWEQWFAFAAMIFTACVILFLPAIQVAIFMLNENAWLINLAEKYKQGAIYIAPAMFALEILFLYFFRISLANYRSVRAQIVQLQLRIALCQFIEGYTDYKNRVTKDDKTGLDKFEALIFSGISIDEGKIPTTFDGVGELGKIIQAIKKAAKD